MREFPYFATPNTELQTIAGSVELAAAPDAVWSLIGQFNLEWHPAVARTRLTGTGIGQLRRTETRDGREIIERLEEVDNARRSLLADRRRSRLSLHRHDRSHAERQRLRRQMARGILRRQSARHCGEAMVSTLVETGLGSLKPRFGAAA
jgi:hypothetical protein